MSAADIYQHSVIIQLIALNDVLQKTQRLAEVLKNLVNIAKLRLSDRKLKQNIRDLRFATKSKHRLLKKFAESVSPYAWRKMEKEIKIMKKKSYDFVLNKETSTYNIASCNTTYHLKSDLTACTCDFFMAFELPCRHIISFHIQENTEIPTGSFAEHWRNEYLEL
ncbi:hypothetical protein OUZ56_010184 [Daphnia magna]|uniref:SWIM-type domain-containing protein n=1 Tax=Daphnia magna TaxID=35525 RepID=A0ABR0AI28_9CRUS|nr:hypothetical protein OUZ56_010184 [Daphnia magna]